MIDNFVHLGGSGATLGLLVALLWKAREGTHRHIAQLSLLPTLFNVNELLLFGLPVVLRPQFLLPFVLLPVGLALAGWAMLASGLLPLQATTVHWTTPALLSGWLLTGSWKGVAWQLLVIAVSTACYLPAVTRIERARHRRQLDALTAAAEAILGARHRHRPALLRRDQAGEIARGLLSDLGRAIGTPEVHLAYQPKHRADGTAVGAEALVRWTHPRYGEIRADVAVTLAEDGELAARLGHCVLEQACACKARWNARGLQAATLAVNVSPLQLSIPGFAGDVIALLERHGLAGREIELEITESHALPLGSVLQDNMRRLAHHGVRLAMDDFGMGHSSLLHLRHFRVDAIKIDGSLSREVPASDAACDIVRSIATLGRSQQLDVVAEFVETREQRNALAALGCTLFQGYLHSPPLAEAACLDYLLAYRPASATPAAPAAPAALAAPAVPQSREEITGLPSTLRAAG
ncbi:MAG: PTS sugar transporter subunit IIC/EAL domain-containing protein [Rubrivivax sp.]|nr:PTS sugar transporter subunit IIC/EAL domain-containing protein [Rubrivivax sp.]